MLKKFPGRTLEELDEMDWLRFKRARDAERVQEIEDQRRKHIAGKLDPAQVSPELWDAWAEHNALVEDDD